MYSTQLTIDTSGTVAAGPSSLKMNLRGQGSTSLSTNAIAGPSKVHSRMRSTSNASTSSSLSIVSPASSSGNASSSSLVQLGSENYSRSRSVSPTIDETVQFGPQYVLAMHDYAPQQQNATCLSFRAGQVIHVLNRDSSGWWDGELDGRRGWFPSNYVNADVTSLTEEEPPEMQSFSHHKHSKSAASATSWLSSTSSRSHGQHSHHRSLAEVYGQEGDLYCPEIMIPLLQGLSLLQNAVSANRINHFQPSTACIISCVRSILSETDTLQRDAPILQRFPILAEERRRILTILAALVAQAKKASEEIGDDETRNQEIENMLRLGGQAFAHMRKFLAVAVQFGVELPEQQASGDAIAGSMESEARRWSNQSDLSSASRSTPTQQRHPDKKSALARMKSLGDIRTQKPETPDMDSHLVAAMALENRGKEKHPQNQLIVRHAPESVRSVSPNSSTSSQNSSSNLSPPPFPSGPSTSTQVMEALRYTHDQYLSTIAAFIGHAHSHSRSSHASSTGHLYDLVREIVEMVCKLLTIVEAVMLHPNVPVHRISNLKSAKEGLYNVTSSLADSVRHLTASVPATMPEEEEKQILLRSATGALKAGADCVAAVKVCLNRSIGDRPFVVNIPTIDGSGPQAITPSKFSKASNSQTTNCNIADHYKLAGTEDEDLTIQAKTPSPIQRTREMSSGSDNSNASRSSWKESDETDVTSLDESKPLKAITVYQTAVEPDLPSPTSFVPTEDGTTWEGSTPDHAVPHPLDRKLFNGDLPTVPTGSLPQSDDSETWLLSHDYSVEDVAYNSDGHLVGATMDVLVEKMTPHDSIVDPAFSAVFFMTFRLFSSPLELVDAVISRYNLIPPNGISYEDLQLWQQSKGIPVRLRVSNFIKIWVEMYWRPGVDDPALLPLTTFTTDGLALLFPGPAQRILELLNMRRLSTDMAISPKGERIRDPGMSINPPYSISASTEVPRPMMTKTLLVALRKKDFGAISVTEFDALELARQLSIMECNLYCAIQAEEILETGQEGTKPPVNVKAVSSLSTAVTGWVAECILSEPDIKKRTLLIKFFIKVADRCTSINNYSTSRSILAALDSSTISRLHQTWLGLPQKYKTQLETLRRLADHSRNYHEYRTKLRNTAPPAVPFLGLYLTDVTFCREGNPSHRASPMDSSRKLLNFNKYHKLARIVQDMQRFQVPYNLKAIPEVQEYLNVAFENSRHHGDLQDLYRRSLLVEPKQAADAPPTSDMRQLFNWATRSQTQTATPS